MFKSSFKNVYSKKWKRNAVSFLQVFCVCQLLRHRKHTVEILGRNRKGCGRIRFFGCDILTLIALPKKNFSKIAPSRKIPEASDFDLKIHLQKVKIEKSIENKI